MSLVHDDVKSSCELPRVDSDSSSHYFTRTADSDRPPAPRASPHQDRAVFGRDMVWIGGPYALPPDYAFPPMPAILWADDRMVLLGPPPPGGLLVLNASGLPPVDPWGGGASPSWVAGPQPTWPLV